VSGRAPNAVILRSMSRLSPVFLPGAAADDYYTTLTRRKTQNAERPRQYSPSAASFNVQ